MEERQQLQAQLTQTEATGSQQLLQTAELRSVAPLAVAAETAAIASGGLGRFCRWICYFCAIKRTSVPVVYIDKYTHVEGEDNTSMIKQSSIHFPRFDSTSALHTIWQLISKDLHGLFFIVCIGVD